MIDDANGCRGIKHLEVQNNGRACVRVFVNAYTLAAHTCA